MESNIRLTSILGAINGRPVRIERGYYECVFDHNTFIADEMSEGVGPNDSCESSSVIINKERLGDPNPSTRVGEESIMIATVYSKFVERGAAV